MDLLGRFAGMEQYVRQATLVLGGSTGSGGGSGGPIGGASGLLIQTRVAGDTDESFQYTQSSGSVRHLLDNLNRIRSYIEPSHNFYATGIAPEPTNYLHISSGSWQFADETYPMLFSGGETPAISVPLSGSGVVL